MHCQHHCWVIVNYCKFCSTLAVGYFSDRITELQINFNGDLNTLTHGWESFACSTGPQKPVGFSVTLAPIIIL